MFDRLEDLVIRYQEVMGELQEPDVANDPERFRKLMKEQSDLAPIVEAYQEYKKCKQNVEESLMILFFFRRIRMMIRTLSLRSVPVQVEMRLHFLRQKFIVCMCIMQTAADGRQR